MLLVRVGLNCHLLTLKKTVSSMDVEDDDLEQLRRAALRTMKRYPSQSRGRGALFKPHPLYSNLISIIPCVEEEPLEKPPQQPEVVSKFNRFNDSKAESSGGDETEGEQDKKCGSTGEADTSFEDLIYQLQQALDDDGSEQKAGSNGEKPLPDTTCNSGSKSASPVVDGSSKHSAVKRELSPVEDKAPVAVDSSLSPEVRYSRSSVAHSRSRRLSRSPSLYRNHSPPWFSAQSVSRYTQERDTPSRSPVTPPRKQQPLSPIPRRRVPLQRNRQPLSSLCKRVPHSPPRKRWYHPPVRKPRSPWRQSPPPLRNGSFSPKNLRRRRTRSPSPWSPEKSKPCSPPRSNSFSSISSSTLSSESEARVEEPSVRETTVKEVSKDNDDCGRRTKNKSEPSNLDTGDKENGNGNVPSCTGTCRASKRTWKSIAEPEDEPDDVLDLGLERSTDFTSSDEDDEVMKVLLSAHNRKNISPVAVDSSNPCAHLARCKLVFLTVQKKTKAPKTRGSNSVNVAHSPASKKHKGRVVSLRGASPTAEADREEKAVSSKKLRKLPVKTPNRSLEKLVKKQETATTNGRVKAVSLKRDSESSPDDQETEVRLPLNAEAPRRPLSQSRRESELRSIVCEVAESSADEEVMVGKARMDLRAKLVQNRTRKPMAERWYRPTRILQSALEGIYVGVKGSEDGERLSMKKARPSQGAKYKPSSSSSPVVNHERRRDRMFSYVNLKKGKEDSFVARSIGQGPVLFFEYLTSSFLSARPICTNWDIRWILFCVAMVKCRLQPIS
ncbi:uncharacterized protein [Anabrus simplex]|uniref:uncharacterized protein isoform X3 n=1 Tax=Anabrus simplex TaxID=316456 RepID=UPI0035A34295